MLIRWPIDEFLPGVGYEQEAKNLQLFTRDCFGVYNLIHLEDSLTYDDGREVSEVDKKVHRPLKVNSHSVEVVEPEGMFEWSVLRLYHFINHRTFELIRPLCTGNLRDIFDIKDGNVYKATDQQDTSTT